MSRSPFGYGKQDQIDEQMQEDDELETQGNQQPLNLDQTVSEKVVTGDTNAQMKLSDVQAKWNDLDKLITLLQN